MTYDRATIERHRARLREVLAPVGGHLLFALVFAGLFALLVPVALPEVLDGQLMEPDNYMRLVRVTHLAETGDWYDNSIPRSSAPSGAVLHWTRPLDVVLLGTTAPLLVFFPFPQALHLAGVFLPPLILLFTCFAAAWASSPFAGRSVRYFAMIAVLAQPGIVAYGLPGRIDHHALLILLFALSFGLAVRWLSVPHSPSLAMSAGGVLGLGLWVSPEFLVPTALVLIAGAMAWIVDAGDNARKNLWLSVGVLGTLVVALLLEHPPARLLAEEYDRISAPHVFFACLVVSFWMLAVKTAGIRARPGDRVKGIWRRFSFAVLGFTAAAGTLFMVYQGFFRGPLADIDPEVWRLWHQGIAEGQPLVPVENLSEAGTLISFLGASVFCIPFVGYSLATSRQTSQWWSWVLLALALAVYTWLALHMVRHVAYTEILLVVATVTLLSRILPALNSVRSRHLRTAARAGVAGLLITGPGSLGLVVASRAPDLDHGPRQATREVADRCSILDIASFLSVDDGLGDRVRTIAANVDYGPEILYRTPHRVVGTLHHRNADGILAVFGILQGTDLDRVRALVQARGVDLILACALDSWIYRAESSGAGPSLHDMLLAGNEPDWLERVQVPEVSAGAFRLFSVRPTR